MDHPLYFLLHDEPNPEMTSFVFWETLMTHLLLWGNAYSQIIRNGKGEIVAWIADELGAEILKVPVASEWGIIGNLAISVRMSLPCGSIFPVNR